MTWWVVGLLAVASGVLVYRRVGFIRMDKPDVEQRRDLFKSMGPRYRRTQDANRWQLRIRNPRLVRRRMSA
jgi:hypothetical protein